MGLSVNSLMDVAKITTGLLMELELNEKSIYMSKVAVNERLKRTWII